MAIFINIMSNKRRLSVDFNLLIVPNKTFNFPEGLSMKLTIYYINYPFSFCEINKCKFANL